MAEKSLTPSSTLAKGAAYLIAKPIELTWKGIKKVGNGVFGYAKGAIADTFWGFGKAHKKIKAANKDSVINFADATLKRKEATLKTKEAIKSVLEAGGHTRKWLAKIIKGTAMGIGEVFMGPINGLFVRPFKKIIVEPTKKYVIEPTKKYIIEPVKELLWVEPTLAKAGKVVSIDSAEKIKKAA